jgi:sugar lactone lactonase YvrE
MVTSAEPNCVLDGGRYFEGPRWHAGRLWFVDCMDRTLLSLAPSGECEQHAKFDDDTPCGLGVLPDGKLIVLTMFRKRLLTYSDGQLSLYADLSGIAAGTIDDMIIDGLGRAYVGDLGFDLPPPPDRGPVGRIILVAPDGAMRVVADGLRFPNGIAVSADNSRLVVAEMDGERCRGRNRRCRQSLSLDETSANGRSRPLRNSKLLLQVSRDCARDRRLMLTDGLLNRRHERACQP